MDFEDHVCIGRMRLNRGTKTAVLVAALAVSGSVICGLEQNRLERQRVVIPEVRKNQARKPGSNDQQFLSGPPSPSSLRFSHLSVADGLSHADVRAIAQDHQGFMWFGTWLGGLNRYDGCTFKAYRHDDQDERSLNDDTVRTLFVDHTGVLWISTHGPGLERYDRHTDFFRHYRHDPHDPYSLPDNNVKAFFEDEIGTMWVGTLGGLSRFDRSSGKFFTYRARSGDPGHLRQRRPECRQIAGWKNLVNYFGWAERLRSATPFV